MCKLDRVEQRGIVAFDLTNMVTSVRPGSVPFKTAPYGSRGDKLPKSEKLEYLLSLVRAFAGTGKIDTACGTGRMCT